MQSDLEQATTYDFIRLLRGPPPQTQDLNALVGYFDVYWLSRSHKCNNYKGITGALSYIKQQTLVQNH